MNVDHGELLGINQFYDPQSHYIFNYEENPTSIEYVSPSTEPSEFLVNNLRFPASNEHDDESHEFCQICGDIASGWHCGAITCEACKKFFLRSVSTKNDGRKKYQCHKEFQCQITKRSRTQCQYCRLTKCLAVGMRLHGESNETKSEELYKKLPCLVCAGSASGIHFGAVTCEACKGFFRRSIRENAPERYQCVENNRCEISWTSKITCRSCRFEKCLRVGMSIEASRIGRQSNLFKQSIRQLQNGSTSMATINDSVRIASMAKKRKSKTKSLTIRSSFQIELELNPSTKDFIEHIHNGYVKYLKNLPVCVSYETVWSTIGSQLMNYAHSLMNFCQMTITNFLHFPDHCQLVSSAIHSIVMLSIFYDNQFPSTANYWRAEPNLEIELIRYFPEIKEIEQLYGTFQNRIRDFQLDEKEFSLLLFMILTRTTRNISYDENQIWTRCQFDSVQAFSQYVQLRRSTRTGSMPVEFYDIAFLVSQLRSLNHRFSQCFAHVPWSTILPNLPPFFFQIFAIVSV